MNIQAYINIGTALVVFVGGLVVVFIYPGQMSTNVRVLIGLLVLIYFVVRMGQAYLMLKRPRGLGDSLSKGPDDAANNRPKRP